MADIDWEPDSLEIRSKTVEKILEPLIYQVSLLVSHKGPSSRKKGQSKQADSIIKSINDMVQDFLSRGEEIMLEAPERQRDFRSALQDVERSGKDLCRMSEYFLTDSINIEKRKSMINAMKAMLSAVTRLMILSDIVDAYILLRAANRVLTEIQIVQESPDLQRLTNNWKTFNSSVIDLLDLVGIKLRDLIDERKKSQMAAARGIIKRQMPLFSAASKANIRHPELSSTKSNRDYAAKSIVGAVDLIVTAIKGHSNSQPLFYEMPGELATVLDNFDKHAIMKPDKYTDADGKDLAMKLDRIVNDCQVLVSSPCTRANNKQAIVTEGKNAEKNVQILIKAYKASVTGSSSSSELRQAQSKMLQSTEKLRLNLMAAVADHISDTFLDINEPLQLLIDAAKSGNEDNLESIDPFFSNSIAKMVEVSKLACSVSLNYDGVKMVRLAANQVELLYPEVVNAARSLVLRPSTVLIAENMTVFQGALSSLMTLLSDAVDNITNIRDYLTVVDAHVAEDTKLCASAECTSSYEDFYQNISVIRNRVLRACNTVHGEMEGFRKSEYRNRVEDCLRDAEEQVMPNFEKLIGVCLDKIGNGQKVDDTKLREELGEVYDAIHEIWRAVVFGRDQSGYDTDRLDTDQLDTVDGRVVSNQEDQILQTDNPKSEREVMKMISGQHNPVIDKEMASFFEQRKRLIHETTKWDESGNEIVLIAKKMGMLMIEMTDFTRGMGPLKSATDVIETAEMIVQCGNDLNRVMVGVIRDCPSSNHKTELERCMERVTLYCHQLKMTSRVTADIHGIGEEIVVSGLDSVTSLIDNGKNLMAAVVETVKASYIATTKYKGAGTDAGIQWRMKAPTKKPLVHRDQHGDQLRSSKMEPMDELDQFDH